jgi:choline-sulfatase
VARPFRYTFILVLVAAAATLAAFGGWRFARASAPVNGPIVLISIDTLRADHLPAYGYRDLRTPAIDTLAADGAVFTRAYAHAPQTLPAHVAILSGRLPFETGVRDENVAIKPNERLLPQLLRDRGYKTAGIVSSALLGRSTGLARGFDFFDEPDLVSARRDGGDSEAVAERWLDSAGTSRAFLFLHLDEPRAPYAEHLESASATIATLKGSRYDDAVAYADEIVGRLIKYLKTHQLYDRSTIVLLSDHGEGLGDHGETAHGLFLYDEAVHVPLVVKQPAGVGAGVRVSSLVQQIDVVPTVLDLVKAPTPGHLLGRSLITFIDDHSRQSPRTVYAEALYGNRHFGWSPLAMITDGRYVYIKAPREELFDLAKDPRQQVNLAHERAKDRQTLASALDRDYRGGGDAASTRQMAAGDTPLVDPKDAVQIVETYRAAENLAASRKWAQAIRLLQNVIKDDPGVVEVWSRLAADAMRIERYEQAADAYARGCDLDPSDASAFLGAASALLELRRLDEARDRAAAALDVAGERDLRTRAAAHELLARIALARRDADEAREQARLAHQADPKRPLPAFIAARLLYDQGNFDEAAPFFEEAVDAIARSHGEPIAELHFYTAATLARLDRVEEAKTQYEQELAAFPANTRASAALAMLCHATGASAEADRIVSEMVDVTPTPETYALAARLWTTFGDSRQAAAARSEARKALGDLPGR